MNKTYSNIKFISRTGCMPDTKFKASVEVKTATGILWFKKENTETVELYSGVYGFFKFSTSGRLTPIEVDRLIDIHNHTCNKEHSLEY